MNEIGDLRRRAKLTQTEVASAIGVTQGTVSQWENGLAWPHPAKMKAIALLYGCTVSELYDAQISEYKTTCNTSETKGVV